MKFSEAPCHQMLRFEESCEYPEGFGFLPGGIEGYKPQHGRFIIVGGDLEDDADFYNIEEVDPEVTIMPQFCRDTITCNVPIPANHAHDAKFRRTDKPIDKCLAPLVNALNALGVYTAGCCCGHGKYPGSILLHDTTPINLPPCKVMKAANV